nr:TPA_asm: hypothetical protein HUJ06_003253 [Nelumbo nucifera]
MAANNSTRAASASGPDPVSSHTTFVQADPSTFRAVVQKLTGATDDPSMEKLPVTVPARQATKSSVGEMGPRKTTFKLHERRQSMRKLEIKLGGIAARQVLVSPVSPLDLFSRGSPRTPRSPLEEEERAIAEKGFYLHPSPLNTPRIAEPELLPLFPLHSPRESSSS